MIAYIWPTNFPCSNSYTYFNIFLECNTTAKQTSFVPSKPGYEVLVYTRARAFFFFNTKLSVFPHFLASPSKLKNSAFSPQPDSSRHLLQKGKILRFRCCSNKESRPLGSRDLFRVRWDESCDPEPPDTPKEKRTDCLYVFYDPLIDLAQVLLCMSISSKGQYFTALANQQGHS